MIWIVSQNTSEVSTEIVMDWVQHLGGTCRRLNGIDLLGSEAFAIEVSDEVDVHFRDGNSQSKPPVAWFRRWMQTSLLNEDMADPKPYSMGDVQKLVKSEFAGLTDAFFQATQNNRWYEPAPAIQPKPTKLAQLQRARECGLTIPATIITNNKKELLAFSRRLNGRSLIIKPIKEIQLVCTDDAQFFSTYTKVLPNDLCDVPEVFFPSLFQEAVSKVYELRVFYFNEECYSMAIFSQDDEQTKDDFRRYNLTKPNRYIPHQLSDELVAKMRHFMRSFDMQTGSFDFLVDEADNHFFLEVNPGGQFGMVSFPCNYYLEREVAQHLVNMSLT